VPFLDYRLVEFVLSLPNDYVISGGITKRLLRTAMKDILPPKIHMRMDKIGFETPEELWIRENNHEFIEAFQQSIEVSQGIIRPSALNILRGFLTGRRPYSSLIWRLICFGSWVKRFGVSLK
jgi:asparagine synthase (glutamine-hydrolysing)